MPSVLPADVAAVHDGWRRRGHFVTLAEGQRLFVAQEGEGPDLLLVHGFPSTSHDFAAALPLLGAHFRVTAFDPRLRLLRQAGGRVLLAPRPGKAGG